MSPSYLPFDLTRILSFDLELGRDEKLRHLGAILDQQVLNIKGNTIEAINLLEQLVERGEDGSIKERQTPDFVDLGAPMQPR